MKIKIKKSVLLNDIFLQYLKYQSYSASQANPLTTFTEYNRAILTVTHWPSIYIFFLNTKTDDKEKQESS